MGRPTPATGKRTLLTLLLVHAAASLIHFSHNAEFLSDYPNMPAWLSPAGVYAAWLVEAAVGITGLVLFLRGHAAGLFIIAAYGVLGLAGLDHYTLAPLTAHTFTMNLTIWLETLTAAALLMMVGILLMTRHGNRIA